MGFWNRKKKDQLTEALRRELAGYLAAHAPKLEKVVIRKTQKACYVSHCGAAPMEAAPMPVEVMEQAAPMRLEELLRQQDKGFTETLLQLIDKSGKKDSQVYKKANLSKQHFSKIRNDPNYKPKKTTAVALAVALELDLDGTRDLIGRAGYALTNSSKFDLIVRFFIEQKNYNIVQINMALYEFDQSLLGA